MDEDDVHIRDIVQLPGTAFAHSDDGQLQVIDQLTLLLTLLSTADRQRGLDGGRGEVGQLPRHQRLIGQGVCRAEVSQGQGGQFAAIGRAQPQSGVCDGECLTQDGLRHLSMGIRLHGAQQSVPQLSVRGDPRRLGGSAVLAGLPQRIGCQEQVCVLGAPDQEFADRLGGPQQAHQRNGTGILTLHLLEELLDLRGTLQQTDQQQDRLVGVRCVPQRT